MLEDGTFELLPLFLENLQRDLDRGHYKPRLVWFVRGRDEENPDPDDDRRVHEYFADTLVDEIREALDVAVFFKTLLLQLRLNPGLKFSLQDDTVVPEDYEEGTVVDVALKDLQGAVEDQPEVKFTGHEDAPFVEKEEQDD